MDTMTPRPSTMLLRARDRLVPDGLKFGWMPFFNLGYLVFLFLPLLFANDAGEGAGTMRGWYPDSSGRWLPTLVSVAVFLPVYFIGFHTRGNVRVACMLGIAALAYVLLPANPFANTYLIYAAGFAAFAGRLFWQRSAWLALILAIFLAEVLLFGYPVFVFALTAVIAIAVFFGNHFFIENTRRRAELKLSHDEVKRLAALAERERIGRDLHDLLGHTLAMVALKSELAGRLLDKDPQAARREIDDVARGARDALSQVRRAVSGIRAAGLAAELASARLLLETDGVGFRYEGADLLLTPELETVLALALREAITNIQRHARAGNTQVALSQEGGEAVLSIVDDGRGGALVPGNGLAGMRERIELLGGQLRVESGRARGTRVEVRLPLPRDATPLHANVPSR
ncbi:MAG: sensor histidine kinase [Pseudomonadota bacterium]|nr:sensor histidine kinase [Pseudomonadota bacterium]